MQNKIVLEDLGRIVSCGANFEKLRGKSVMITGATGMLAKYVVYTLMHLNDMRGLGIKIYPLARNMEKLQAAFDIERADVFPVVQDVCEPIMFEDKVDYIFHLASAASAQALAEDPVGVIKANIVGTSNVLELAKAKGALVFFSSTREIYGEVSIDKISESDMGAIDPLEVRMCYPESKRAAENLIVSYAKEYGVKYQIVRMAHVYGPGMMLGDGRIMSDLMGNAVAGEDIVLKSTGEALRAFCYISDAVSAMFYVVLSDAPNEVYNVANETEEISVRDLAEKMGAWFGISVRYEIQENNGQYVKFKRVGLNTAKLGGLGWKPEVLLEEGVKRTAEACWG